jgi:hypothetical protein
MTVPRRIRAAPLTANRSDSSLELALPETKRHSLRVIVNPLGA